MAAMLPTTSVRPMLQSMPIALTGCLGVPVQVIRIIAVDLHKSFNGCTPSDARKPARLVRQPTGSVSRFCAYGSQPATGAADSRRRLVKQSSMGSFLHKSSGFFGKAGDSDGAGRRSFKRGQSSRKYCARAAGGSVPEEQSQSREASEGEAQQHQQ